jgi:hypothetical protein
MNNNTSMKSKQMEPLSIQLQQSHKKQSIIKLMKNMKLKSTLKRNMKDPISESAVSKVQARALLVRNYIFLNIFIGENEPMLYVDVNLGNSGTQRIVVYEGDTAEGLAEKFG